MAIPGARRRGTQRAMHIGLYVAPGSPLAAAAGLTMRRLAEELGATCVAILDDAQTATPSLSCSGVIVLGAFAFDATESSNAGGPGGAEADQPLRAVVAFARAGGPVLGIGAGFQILCSLGLLPGRVSPGASTDPGAPALAAACHLRVEGRPTPFTSAIPAGRVMRLLSSAAPVSARYETDQAEALEARGQVIFRYCDAAGGATAGAAMVARGGPTTTTGGRSIAGVCDAAGGVVGLLADPGDDGHQLLRSLRMHLR
jgi:phosphoribosylformylglycinamidine (FGAM) synthase-like amidotransferase family enzyme